MRACESFGKEFSVKSLRSSFQLEVKEKLTVGIDRVTVAKFEENLDQNLKTISRKILKSTYHFTNYSQLLISKEVEKLPQELCVPTVRDKLVLKALSHVLKNVFYLKLQHLV
jgi:retron-type reverse transcriptase